jgi:hypothetical protein
MYLVTNYSYSTFLDFSFLYIELNPIVTPMHTDFYFTFYYFVLHPSDNCTVYENNIDYCGDIHPPDISFRQSVPCSSHQPLYALDVGLVYLNSSDWLKW